MDHVSIGLTLRDARHRAACLKTKVQVTERGILIGAEGYGEKLASTGYGTPILIEFCERELRVVIWGDINQEDPTHVISLENAREDLYKEDDRDDN